MARAWALPGGLVVVTRPGEEGRGSSLPLEWPGLDAEGQGAPTPWERVSVNACESTLVVQEYMDVSVDQ